MYLISSKTCLFFVLLKNKNAENAENATSENLIRTNKSSENVKPTNVASVSTKEMSNAEGFVIDLDAETLDINDNEENTAK